ncbi:hypothetical protein [Variovorax paradoxus]|uniref:hypothetical protein n=1 Tax=Variovorax paradoxus TaxID=34073 RepID=UPI003D649242
MSERTASDATVQAECYYGIRLLVSSSTYSVSQISAALGMEPDYFWNGGISGRERAMWGRVAWTEGRRSFFDEVHEVLQWLKAREDFVTSLVSAGGELRVIVQLPGTIDAGCDLRPESMQLAARLGVRIGVAVYPDLHREKTGEFAFGPAAAISK